MGLSRDAAFVTRLAAAAYTARVTDAGAGSGVTLVEVFDAATRFDYAQPRLINVSARGTAGAGDATLTAGFFVEGAGPLRVLIRAVGPTLASFGLTTPLADPRLTLLRGNATVGENDNWMERDAAGVTSAAGRVGAFALPANSRDAALVTTLEPGAYTAQCVGAGSGTGIALIEIYELP